VKHNLFSYGVLLPSAALVAPVSLHPAAERRGRMFFLSFQLSPGIAGRKARMSDANETIAALQRVSANAAKMIADAAESQRVAALESRLRDAGYSEGEAGFAAGLKIPCRIEGKNNPFVNSADLTEGEAAFARGLVLPK
jgi:hypothetical protein